MHVRQAVAGTPIATVGVNGRPPLNTGTRGCPSRGSGDRSRWQKECTAPRRAAGHRRFALQRHRTSRARAAASAPATSAAPPAVNAPRMCRQSPSAAGSGPLRVEVLDEPPRDSTTLDELDDRRRQQRSDVARGLTKPGRERVGADVDVVTGPAADARSRTAVARPHGDGVPRPSRHALPATATAGRRAPPPPACPASPRRVRAALLHPSPRPASPEVDGALSAHNLQHRLDLGDRDPVLLSACRPGLHAARELDAQRALGASRAA